MITQELVKQLFTYKGGYLFRLTSPSRNTKIGEKVGCIDQKGYLVTGICKS